MIIVISVHDGPSTHFYIPDFHYMTLLPHYFISMPHTRIHTHTTQLEDDDNHYNINKTFLFLFTHTHTGSMLFSRFTNETKDVLFILA